MAGCAACGWKAIGAERELALLCSTRFHDGAGLSALAERIRRGEVLNPSAELREKARAALAPVPEGVVLRRGQMAALAVANLVVTPLLGWAAWFRLRDRPGPAGMQALMVTVPITLGLGLVWGWVLWRGVG